MDMNPITQGLIKAWGLIAEADARRAQTRKPKWAYEGMPPRLHNKPSGKTFVDAYKRAIRIDTSRYDGASLRAIRARGGGPKEQARAAARRTGETA